LRNTDSVSALAFTIVALVLSGPVPAMLARASWPIRAPRAAIVLWQSIALAAVLSAFSAGIAIASRLFVLGPDGRPTATITSEIDALGWPLWVAYVIVFAITLVIGGRLTFAVLQVAIATRRRRAHHRMVVDLVGNEMAAILSHERAHLRARHDLVLEMFTAVHAAFPRFVRSGNALDAVRLLIELLADDAAVRVAGPTPLARALVACAGGRTPSGAL